MRRLPGHEFSPEVARCLKFRLIEFLSTLEEQSYSGPYSGLGNSYWPSIIDLVGPEINQQFNGIELRGLDSANCRAVVASATDTRAPRIFQKRVRPRGRRESFIRASLACLELDSTSSEFRIGLGDAVVLKYAIGDLPSDVFQRISDEVFFKNIHYVQGGCLTESQRRAIRSKILSTFGPPSKWNSDDIGALQCLLYELDPYVMDEIEDSSLVQHIQVLGTCWDERKRENRDFLSQCEQELTHREVNSLKYRIRCLSGRLALLAAENINIYFHPLQSATHHRLTADKPLFPDNSSSNDDKESRETVLPQDKDAEYTVYSNLRMMTEPVRSPEAYSLPGLNMTCDWFKAAGAHVTSMDVHTFIYPGNMTDSEFLRCIPEFGQFPTWKKEQRDQIWKRVIRQIGFPSPPEIEAMGSLILSMDDSELDTLHFGSPGGLDILFSFGKLEGWSQDQLQKLAHRFRLTVTPLMENCDAVQLTALGYIICGFSESEILKINPSAFRMSAVAIGELLDCNTEVLGALARLATKTEAFGNVAYWDGSTIQTLGIILAGLSLENLRRLHPPSLNGLKCNAVAVMSPHQFQSFNTEQLDHFSMDAAMCVRKHHVTLLSEAQRYAVWAAGSDAPRISRNNADRTRIPTLTLAGSYVIIASLSWILCTFSLPVNNYNKA